MWSGVRLANVGVTEGFGASMAVILGFCAANTTGCSGRERSLRDIRMVLSRHDRHIGRHVLCGKEMIMWPTRRLTDLFRIEHPIVLGPMAGAIDADLAIEVAEAG